MTTLYKILSQEAWASRSQHLPWTDLDRKDGFLHLSAEHQVPGTAEKWFAGRTDLVLVALDADRLAPDSLRWEPSRGGDLFPHVYGEVPLDAVTQVEAICWSGPRFTWP